MLEMLYFNLWYFLIFGFLGWISEVIYTMCIDKKFINRGFLSAPFCPIYGFGIVLVYLFRVLFPINNIFLIFIGSTIIASLLELFTGFILEKTFHTKWWDYSSSKFNFFGYISLGFSLLWGVSCTFIINIVLPVFDTIIAYIPPYISLIVFIVVVSSLVIDFLTTTSAIVGINKQAKALSEISQKIKVSVARIAEISNEEAKTEYTIMHEELLTKYDKMLGKVTIIKRRVILAFPDLKNTKYHKEVTDLQLAVKQLSVDTKAFADDMEVKRKQMVLETYEDHLPLHSERPFGYGLCFNKLFILFMIGNVFGYILETIWCFALLGKFEMRVGLVYGPFIPVYGIGAVLITICLYKFYKTRDLWIFLGSMIIGASFEYFCSYFQEMLLGTISWDYTGTFMNIDGRTNLMYGLIWGLLGLVWVKDLYPIISKRIEKIPKKVGNIITISLVIYMLFNAYISCAAVMRQNDRRDGKAPENQFAAYLDKTFDDDKLAFIYPHMLDPKTGIENSER